VQVRDRQRGRSAASPALKVYCPGAGLVREVRGGRALSLVSLR
jgi:hypothetical protein